VVISSIKPETQISTMITEEEWEELNQENEEPHAILHKITTASELAQKAG